MCGSRLKGLMTQVTGVVSCLVAHLKNTPSHSMFHKTLVGVPDTISSFCSSPSQTAPTTRPLTGIRSNPCATSQEARQSGFLAESLPHTSGKEITKRKVREKKLSARALGPCGIHGKQSSAHGHKGSEGVRHRVGQNCNPKKNDEATRA